MKVIHLLCWQNADLFDVRTGRSERDRYALQGMIPACFLTQSVVSGLKKN
jgi:hypothetical protein